MHVGVQGMSTERIDLQFLRRHGVTHMNGGVEDMEVETLVRHRETAAAEGISFEATHVGVGRNITLARDPERDRELDEFCRMIENVSGQDCVRCSTTSASSTTSVPRTPSAAAARATAPSTCRSTTTTP